MKSLGAISIKADPCFWLWLKEDPNATDPHFTHTPLGFVAGHVDDFHRAGDLDDPAWQKIRSEMCTSGNLLRPTTIGMRVLTST